MARGLSVPDAMPSSAATTARRSTTRAGVVRQGRPGQLAPLPHGVRAHAADQRLQRGQEPRLLDIAEGLVEDQVPRVVGGVRGHEDRGAGPVLVVVCLVEEAQLGGHDDEALLGQPLAVGGESWLSTSRLTLTSASDVGGRDRA